MDFGLARHAADRSPVDPILISSEITITDVGATMALPKQQSVAVGQARAAGIPVVFTRHVYRAGRADEGAALIRNSPALAGINGLAAGFWDADVMDELANVIAAWAAT